MFLADEAHELIIIRHVLIENKELQDLSLHKKMAQSFNRPVHQTESIGHLFRNVYEANKLGKSELHFLYNQLKLD
jgi:hypothetical protein